MDRYPLTALLCLGTVCIFLLTGCGPFAQKASVEIMQASGQSEKTGRGTDTESIYEEAKEAEGERKTSDWKLLLVNSENPLPEEFHVSLKEIGSGHAVDERIWEELNTMLEEAKKQGLEPLICSSYRTEEKQQKLYKNKVDSCMAQGMSKEKAEKEAARWVAVPGTSEHQTGLAVDIVDLHYQLLDQKQETTPVQQWLMENAHHFGFILRYPTEKSDLTGICYEPWHYRYVGREAAGEIYSRGLCLEEYLSEQIC